MEKQKIDRINELAKKAKTCGLTCEEKEEQKILRQEYIQAFRSDLKSQLDCMVIVDKKGNRRSLRKDN